MKKVYLTIISLAFVIILLLSLVSCANTDSIKLSQKVPSSSNVVDRENYTYNIKTKTLTINIQGEMKYGHTDAPWIDIEYPEHIAFKKGITSIPEFGFSFGYHGNGGERLNNYDRIKTVKLPTSVQSIGYGAFSYCKKLERINIPKSVKSIDDCSFENCVNLKKITIPGSVKNLSYGLFLECKNLEKVTLKNGIRSIENDAFFGCKKLKSINLPDSITTIKAAFSGGCNSLKSIKLPKNLKKISGYTFIDCKNLKKVTIQTNVTKIGESAFNGCKSLKTITLPKKLKQIGDYAFENCTSLKKITIPKSVKKIGKKAFGYRSIWSDDDDEYTYIPINDFTIKGYKGTAAEKYAKKHGFKFVALG